MDHPPSFDQMWIDKMHGDFEVLLNIGKEDAITTHGCGVRQGETLVPEFLIIAMQLAAENFLRNSK